MKYFATVLLLGEGQAADGAQRALDHPELFEVARSASIDDALELLEHFIFDVVIVVGPRDRLIETVVRIRERAAEIPILVVQGQDAQSELVDRLLAFGAARCIPPGASGSDLREAVLASCA